MEKIDTFEITGITIEGFKCFAEKQSFDLGHMSIITGHNGQGKSSVAEAIAYAITGHPFYGSEQSLDRLYAIGGKNASVELSIKTGDGEKHKLTRCRNDDVTTVTYDGVSIKQSDIYAMFGEKDVFLSIFNPLYFIEVLGDKGRNLLERYLPAIPHEDVLRQLSDNSRLLLETQKMKSPESLLESVRADIKELEESVLYIEGQRDLLEAQARDKRAAIKSKSDEIGTLDTIITALEKKRSEGVDYETLREKIDKTQARYDELSLLGNSPPDTFEVDTNIEKTLTALEKRRAGEYVSQYSAKIAEIDAAVSQLRERYLRENSILSGLTPGISCPMCKQEVTEQNIESIKKSFADSLADVLENGRGYSKQLADLKMLDDTSKAVFEEFRDDDVRKMESELEVLRVARLEILSSMETGADKRRSDMEALKEEIRSLENDIRFGNLMPDEGWALEEYIEDRKKLEAELAALKNNNESSNAQQKDMDIASIKGTIKTKRELEDAIKYYISERSRLMLEGFGSLNRVDIVLYEATKKGLVRDVFKFSYDGKPYKFLSLSEKIKAGLEVSELIKKLTGRNYPVFIDNGESIPVIDNVRPTGQIFIAQVVKGAPLEISGAPETLKAAA